MLELKLDDKNRITAGGKIVRAKPLGDIWAVPLTLLDCARDIAPPDAPGANAYCVLGKAAGCAYVKYYWARPQEKRAS